MAERGLMKPADRAEQWFKYVDLFLKMDCAPTLIQKGMFPTTKDLIESVACYVHALRHFPELFREEQPIITTTNSNNNNLLLVVGDGVTPRTAAIFAMKIRKGYRVTSVDPALRKFYGQVNVIQQKVQHVRIYANDIYIVMMHAHVSLKEVLNSIVVGNVLGLLVCPCCDFYSSQSFWEKPPDFQKHDGSIASKDNLIRIWNFRSLVYDRRIFYQPHQKLAIESFSIEKAKTRSSTEDDDDDKRVSIFGIVARIRNLGTKSTRFFDIWQPKNATVSLQFNKLSLLSRQGKLRPRASPHSMEANCLQCCVSRRFWNNDVERFNSIWTISNGALRHGNVVRVCGTIGPTEHTNFLTLFVESCELLTEYQEFTHIVVLL